MRLESRLASLLSSGTWLASTVVALGLALGRGRIATAGIVLFILLPVARVTLMLVAFLRERDYRMSGIAALVLLFIGLGFAMAR